MALSRLLVFMFVFQGLSLSAQDRYMVFFTDKEQSPYSISSPEEFLSARSLERRAHHNVIVNEQDLPVNPNYLEGLKSVGAEVYFQTKWMNGALVTMETELVSAVTALEYVSSVEMVGAQKILSNEKVDFTVPDTFQDNVLVVIGSNVQNRMIGANDLRSRGATGKGILLAVFDSGFDGVLENYVFKNLHEEGRIKAELDFVRNSGNPYRYSTHGTRVLSCITGIYEDDFLGTAPEVDLILAVTEERPTEYPVEMYNWLFAAEYADSAGVDVINSSLGYVDFDAPFTSWTYNFGDLDGETAVVTRAANWAGERGILIVNSAGNAGGDGDVSGSTFQSCQESGGWCYVVTPADSPHVLSVGAVQSDGETRAYFSSYGPTSDGRTKPDVSAMGFETAVANNTGLIIPNSGTSFSSPLIAGFAASLWQAYPELTNAELREVLRLAGHLSSNPDNILGYGVPNFENILAQIGQPYLLLSEDIEEIEVFPNPFQSSLVVRRDAEVQMSYRLFNYHGKMVSKGNLRGKEEQIKMSDNLEQGLYFLILESGGFTETIKLLKK